MIDLAPHLTAFARQRVVLLDIDGVIANEVHRQPYALNRDWGAYFRLMVHDTVWPRGRELYENALILDYSVGYLTGRREDTRDWTTTWLAQHGFDPLLPLLMRPQEVRTPLAELKATTVRALTAIADQVLLYDDDPEVIEHAKRVPGVVAKHCTWHIKPKRMVKRAIA